MIAADGGHHQDCIGFLGVQHPVCDVGDGKILDNLAALELEVAHLIELVRGLIGIVGGSKGNRRQNDCAKYGAINNATNHDLSSPCATYARSCSNRASRNYDSSNGGDVHHTYVALRPHL